MYVGDICIQYSSNLGSTCGYNILNTIRLQTDDVKGAFPSVSCRQSSLGNVSGIAPQALSDGAVDISGVHPRTSGPTAAHQHFSCACTRNGPGLNYFALFFSDGGTKRCRQKRQQYVQQQYKRRCCSVQQYNCTLCVCLCSVIIQFSRSSVAVIWHSNRSENSTD